MRKRLMAVCCSLLTLFALAGLPAHAAGGRPATKARVLKVRVARQNAMAQRLGSSPKANWTSAGTLVKGVTSTGGAALAGGRVYLPGGIAKFAMPRDTFYNHMQIYTVSTNTWAQDPDVMPSPFNKGGSDFAVCADTSGKIHLLDAFIEDAAGNGFLVSSHLVFDPSAPPGSKWSFLAAPLVGGNNYFAEDAGCAFIGGKLYLFGGLGQVGGGSQGAQKLTWVYNPATNTWADTGKNMITPRTLFGYGATPSMAFVAGGASNITTFQSIAQAERFLPTTGWHPLPNMPTSRIALGLGLEGPIIAVFGGATGNTTIGFTLQPTTQGFNHTAGTWSDLGQNIMTQRWFIGFASGGGKLYMAGGSGAGTGNILNTAEKQP